MQIMPGLPEEPNERRVVVAQLVAFIGLPVVVIVVMLAVIFIRGV